MTSDTVSFVRMRRMSLSVEGMPGEWDFEVAIEGIPDRESGMVINLVEVDAVLAKVLAPYINAQLKDARVFLTDVASDIKARIAMSPGRPRVSRVALHDGESRFSYLP